MVTDEGLHIIGTKMVHLIAPLSAMAAGVLSGSNFLTGFGVGMMVVVLASNMRTVSTYRWRVED